MVLERFHVGDRRWRSVAVLRLLALAAMAVVVGCSGSGGSSGGGFAKSAVLLEIRFPDPGQQNSGTVFDPPDNASLIQQVVFVFSEPPDPRQVGPTTLGIRDAGGFPAVGRYQVIGSRVKFTPELPLRPPRLELRPFVLRWRHHRLA